MRKRWPLPQTIGLYLPALGALFCLSYAAHVKHPFAEWGESGWLLLFAVQYGLLFLLDAGRLEAHRLGERALHAGAVWALALIGAWEISWQVEYHTSGVWPMLSWGLVPALLLAHQQSGWPLL